MVAITVILAAVIGTFVLGLGDQLNQGASAGVSINEDGGSTYTVTVTSLGPNTNTVACGDVDGASNSTVGGTFECSSGSNIVAVTDSGEPTVIRTDI